MKLLFCLLLSSSVFAQKDTTKKPDPDPIIIFQMRASKVPAFFDLLDNSNASHAVVKQYMESFYAQYQQQVKPQKKTQQMPNINLIQAIEADFEIMEGDTFEFYLDFFQDVKDTIPVDLTGSSFVMDIQRPDGCMCFANNPKETLTIGDGLSISDDDLGHTMNRLNVNKILQSTPGKFKQNLIWSDSLGTILTIEKGDLKIEAKV